MMPLLNGIKAKVEESDDDSFEFNEKIIIAHIHGKILLMGVPDFFVKFVTQKNTHFLWTSVALVTS